jgi:hypothetical protein
MDADFREVIVDCDGDVVHVTVVVGDGITLYDDTFEYDDSVFFYFADEAEFQSAQSSDWDGGDFTIVGLV